VVLLTVVGLYPRPGRVLDPILGHKREWSEFRDDPEPSEGAGLSRVVHQGESVKILYRSLLILLLRPEINTTNVYYSSASGEERRIAPSFHMQPQSAAAHVHRYK
jgi:hypothetical protein